MKNLFNLSLCLAVLLVTCESIPIQDASTQSDTKSPNIQTDSSTSLKETPKTKRGLYHGPSFVPAAPLLTAHAPIIAAPAPVIHAAPIIHHAPLAVAAPIIRGASSFSSVRTYHAPLAVAAPILHAPAITAVHAPILHHAPIIHAPTFAAYHAPIYHASLLH